MKLFAKTRYYKFCSEGHTVFSMLVIHKRMLLRYFVTLIPVLTLPLTLPTFSRSQVTTAITSDGTMGTVVNQIGSLHDITGGTRPGNGPNLFHSFGQFSVEAGDVANFRNNTGLPTENILSRVTGGNSSNIFGTIQTQGFNNPNLNLYLMNPAGIIFGPNATLNVSGSTHFTTADYLRLSDGIQFTALPSPQDALLTVAPVAAFGFLESNPASILVNESTLASEGQTLSLVGGDISIDKSGLNAQGGKIALTSVASPGEVLVDTLESAPNVKGQSFTAMGKIALLDGAALDVSGEQAGTVIIRGGRLMVDRSRISANTTGPAGGLAGVPGAGIDIQVTGDLLVDNMGLIEGNVLDGSLDGKDIVLNAGQTLEVKNNSMVHTYALGGSGNAGNIEVNADKVLISKAFTGFESLTVGAFFGNSTGNGGNVNITAKGLQVVDGTITATSVAGTGRGGNVDVNIQGGDISLDGGVISTNAASSSGNAGEVQVAARNLSLTNSSNIETNSFQGATGNAGGVSVLVDGQLDIRERSAISVRSEIADVNGDLTIRAEDIVITGVREGMFPLDGQTGDFTGLSTRTIDGEGGAMHITARNFALTDKAFLNASTDGSGPAGNIFINLSEGLRIADGGEIRAITTGSGAAGKIEITADTVELSGKNAFPFIERDGTDALAFARISTQTDDTGKGGTIGITAREINILDGGSVISNSVGEGDGGTIRLSADTISISGENPEKTAFGLDPRASIITESEGRIPGPEAEGVAGNINIQAGTFNLTQGLVSARTSSAGVGGNIRIAGGQLSLTNGSSITAGSTSTGNSGGINLEAGNTILLNNSQVTTEATESVGGNILLMANNVTLENKAIVSASSSGLGNAGDIQITANDTIFLDKASVNTDAQQAQGGNITLIANDMIKLVDSTIESSVKGGPGTVGGDINLGPNFIILQNSHILAKAVDGQGGNITLPKKGVLVDAQSTLEVTSERGVSGTVTNGSPIQVLSGVIAPLPSTPVNVATLYAARCVAGEGGHFSTFVDSKTDSVAPTPGTFLASPFLPVTDVSQQKTRHNQTPSSEVTLSSHEAAIRLAAYTPPVLFSQGYGSTSVCP